MTSTKQLVKKLSDLVTELIDAMQRVYAEFSVEFLVESTFLVFRGLPAKSYSIFSGSSRATLTAFDS